GELESYLGLVYGLPAGHLFRNSIPLNDFQNEVIGGADVLRTDPSNIAAAVQSFLNPDVRETQAVNRQFGGKPKTPKKKRKQHQLSKSQISGLVLNAGRVAGQAENTTYRLTTHGYTTRTLPAGDQANAPRVASTTTVYYDPVQANAQQAAQQLRPLFGSHARVKQMTPLISSYAARAGNPLTVVTVGTSFPGTLTIPKPPKVEPKTPPQVSGGQGMTAPRLRQVYDEVHFPLMVPHKIARYSELSAEEGVRAFKPLKNQHEVALTFEVGQTSEYWQIEESTWKTAPILQSPSFSFIRKGQRYQVYTSGGAVQRIALVTPQATYWVSNTILNELSNSTMLAIPDGVPGRPLLVMKSTVPVGTGERVRERLDARGLVNVGYVSNPEFTAEGTAVADFMRPDRVVVGAFEPADAERVVELHQGIETEFLRIDVASAELVKLASNAFLSTRISFINEIANVCELVGADVVEV